jgi:hypothetical protein
MEKIELYIVSLWLLFFLIIVVNLEIPICFGNDSTFVGWANLFKKNKISILSLCFLFAGLFFYFRFEYRISGSKKLPVKILEIEDVNYEHLTFLTTYIIPLICFNLKNTRYLIALAILLSVIGVIYVKTDKFYANPTLAVLGYRLYKVTIKTRLSMKKDIIVVTKDTLVKADQIKTLSLDEKIIFARLVK